MDLLTETGTPIWLMVKIAVLIGLIIYIIFAFVIVKQVNLMTDTLELGQERIIRTLSYAHFIFAIFVFFLAFVIL